MRERSAIGACGVVSIARVDRAGARIRPSRLRPHHERCGRRRGRKRERGGHRQHLTPKSASSLRFALKAARHDYVARVREKLAAVERLYLDELMKSRDALEGLQAFIAKRPAKWEHC